MATAWTIERQDACIQIANRAEAFNWLCNETANYYRIINITLLTTIVIFSYIFGSSGILSLFSGVGDQSFIYVNLAIQIMVIITGIIGTITKSLSLDEKITRCRIVSLRYTILFLEIKKEINKDISKRMDFDIFYEKINSEEVDLKNDSIHFPKYIYKKYYRKIGQNSIKFENLYIEHLGYGNYNPELDKQILEITKSNNSE